MTEQAIDVLGIGNAIVDVLARVDDAFLEERELPKGSMQLIDSERADILYAELRDGVACSGGSAANTTVGLLSLGSRAAYIGKVAQDELGQTFAREIRAQEVLFETPPLEGDVGTARCLILVTPDAQRTMMTFLGASALLAERDIDAELVRRARLVYLEGYLFDSPEAKAAFVLAARLAHGQGRRVALTLSDSFCVDRHRVAFREFIADHIDIVFANEDEICALYETDFVAATAALRRHCEIAALTRGARGAVIVSGDQRVEILPHPVQSVVDTTGAGDLFAAGFLHGLIRGGSLEAAGRCGAIAAAEIISHFGARPERSLAALVAMS